MNGVPRIATQDRRLRIELLRLQAAYERLELARDGAELAHELHPRMLAARARDGLTDLGAGWVARGFRFSQRFPRVLSLAGALLASAPRRHLLLKALFIGGLVWLGKHPPAAPGGADAPDGAPPAGP